MKKYLLNLFPNHEFDDQQLTDQSELAIYIGIYNHEQPGIDFKNWIHNKLPYKFLLFEVGQHESPKRYDIEFRDQSKRVGYVDIITFK
jgi:hypothetical protein